MVYSEAIVAAMDEAGRGSWAGPVVAAAVILPKGTKLPGLTDSKLLNFKQRELLFEKIIKKCEYGIGIIDHSILDKGGLLYATYLAFKSALEFLPRKVDHILIDGRDKFQFYAPHTSIIKGDLKIRAISAASIIAKVTRDRIMLEYSKKYPAYGFERHMGYGTREHKSSLLKYGACEIHRRSYAPIKEIIWKQNAFL